MKLDSQRFATISAEHDRVIPDGNAYCPDVSHWAKGRGGHIDMLFYRETIDLVLQFLEVGHLATPNTAAFDS